MSAATAILVVVSAALVIATLVMMSATTAATRQVLNQVLYLLIGSLAVLEHLALKLQRFACQGVVRVNRHTVFLNLQHLRHEALVVLAHQGDNGALEDVLVVEMAVDREDIAAQLVLTLRDVFAKSLGGLEGEVELCTLLHIHELLLESVECDAEASDKLKRTFRARLLLQSSLSVGYGVEFVNDREESVFLLIHIP